MPENQQAKEKDSSQNSSSTRMIVVVRSIDQSKYRKSDKDLCPIRPHGNGCCHNRGHGVER
jgi:hypothetical protein